MMNILVTGAAGFIGSTLTIWGLEQGDALPGIDKPNARHHPWLKKEHLERLRKYPAFAFGKLDITDCGFTFGGSIDHYQTTLQIAWR